MSPTAPDPVTHAKSEREERILLLASALATVAMSAASVVTGLLIDSKAVVFDGMYDAVDAGMTMASWSATKLIARGADRRFQYGYWHLEPMLAFLNSAILLFACLYAAVDGIGGLLIGGRPAAFDIGGAVTGASGIISFAIYAYMRRKRRTIKSALIALDAQSWLFGGTLSVGLSAAFLLGHLLEAMELANLAGHLDAAVLLVLAVIMTPLPVLTIIKAGREILQIAPAELDARVDAVAREIARRHGFIEHRSYVTQVGRAQFIEIGLVAPSGTATKSFAELDQVRLDIALALGGIGPGHWLTVDFTADRRWI